MKLLIVAAGLALAAAASPPTGERALHDEMKGVIAPQAQILWDVSNGAMDDNGKADGAKLKPADWAKLADAGEKLRAAATRIASATHVTVKLAGARLQDEGGPGASTPLEIQGYIDADPKTFAAQARALAAVSDDFVKAANMRNATTLMDASGRLDEVCEACHVKFWYPKQAG